VIMWRIRWGLRITTSSRPLPSRASSAIAVQRNRPIRPGKPTWFARLGAASRYWGSRVLPRRPWVCAQLFLRGRWVHAAGTRVLCDCHVVARAGRGGGCRGANEVVICAPWWRNRRRGAPWARPFDDQDTSLVSVFAAATALIFAVPPVPGQPAAAPRQVILLRLAPDGGTAGGGLEFIRQGPAPS